jgi:hypothetical protein
MAAGKICQQARDEGGAPEGNPGEPRDQGAHLGGTKAPLGAAETGAEKVDFLVVSILPRPVLSSSAILVLRFCCESKHEARTHPEDGLRITITEIMPGETHSAEHAQVLRFFCGLVMML